MLLTLYIVAIFFLHFAHCQLKKIRYQYNYNYFFIWPTRIMMYRSILYYHNRALHTAHRLYFAFILGHIRVPHHFFGGPESSPIVCLLACTMTEIRKKRFQKLLAVATALKRWLGGRIVCAENGLVRVQRVHQPADLWDITFCTR